MAYEELRRARKRVYYNTAPAKMAVAEDILKDPYFADLDIDLSQFSEEEKTIILGVMQKAKVNVENLQILPFILRFLIVNKSSFDFFTLYVFALAFAPCSLFFVSQF